MTILTHINVNIKEMKNNGIYLPINGIDYNKLIDEIEARKYGIFCINSFRNIIIKPNIDLI